MGAGKCTLGRDQRAGDGECPVPVAQEDRKGEAQVHQDVSRGGVIGDNPETICSVGGENKSGTGFPMPLFTQPPTD